MKKNVIKKLAAFFVATAMVACLTACAGNEAAKETQETKTEEAAVEETAEGTENPQE